MINKLRRSGEWVADNPLYAILFALSLAMFLFSIYLASPFYVPGPNATISQVFQSKGQQFILAFIYGAPCAFTMFSVIINRLDLIRKGAFGLFAVYTFATVLRIDAIGVFPLIWIFLLACGLIAGICRISLGFKEDGTQ